MSTMQVQEGAIQPKLPWVYVILGAATILEYFEINMVLVMLPMLYKEFGDPAAVGWTLTIFGLVGAAAVATGGRIGDIFGYRRVLLFAVAASVIGSFVSATSTDLFQLVVGRGIQGTAAVILPVAIALIRQYLKSPERTKFATGVIAGVGYSAAGIAPIVGAIVITSWGWHASFIVSGIFAVIVFLLVLTLPKDNTTGGRLSDIDFVGAFGLAAGVVVFLLGITQGSKLGWTSPVTLGLISVGTVVLILWWIYERAAKNPIVDTTLFKSRGFLVSCICFILFALTLPTGIALSLLAQNPVSTGGFGVPPTLYATVASIGVFSGVLINFLGGYLAARIGARNTIIIGAAVHGVTQASVGVFVITTDARPLWLLFVLGLLAGFGVAILNTALPSFVPETVERSKTGVALGIQQVFKQASQSAGQQLTAVVLVLFPLVAATAGGPATITSKAAVGTVWLFAGAIALLIIPVALLAPRISRANSEGSEPEMLGAMETESPEAERASK